MKKGILFYVVGPSGVGKDTLLEIAKKSLQKSTANFPRRYITRASETGGENHISISEDEFHTKIDESFFGLWWQSHNNLYGIAKNDIDSFLLKGINVVVNGSRGYHSKALKTYPNMKTVLITASEETIKERLTKRGRENKSEIDKRIKRSSSFKDFFGKENIILINNDCSIEASSKEFITILSE